jgi:hypothetical protein
VECWRRGGDPRPLPGSLIGDSIPKVHKAIVSGHLCPIWGQSRGCCLVDSIKMKVSSLRLVMGVFPVVALPRLVSTTLVATKDYKVNLFFHLQSGLVVFRLKISKNKVTKVTSSRRIDQKTSIPLFEVNRSQGQQNSSLAKDS